MGDLPQNDNTQPSNCGQTITIEVVNRNGGSKIIEVNLADKKYKAKSPTLATVLTGSEDIEAVCKEQLSCSTCIGEIESDCKLPKASEDELDVLDSATKGSPSSTVRLSCQIPLKSGQNYKFTQV